MKNHRDAPSYSIPLEARAPLMAQLAFAWDGQWFLKVYDKFGWDVASEINARVGFSKSKIEMKAVLRALGKREADDLADALAVCQGYMEIFNFASDAFVDEQVIEDDTIHATVTNALLCKEQGAPIWNTPIMPASPAQMYWKPGLKRYCRITK